MFTLPTIAGIAKFLASPLGRGGMFALALAITYGVGVFRGRLVEARESGAGLAAAQLEAEQKQNEALMAQASHNAATTAALLAEQEISDERYRRLAQSRKPGTTGRCNPFTPGELREFNALLRQAGAGVSADRRQPDQGSGPAAEPEGLDYGQWAIECARRDDRLRRQLRAIRSWSRTSPQFKRK